MINWNFGETINFKDVEDEKGSVTFPYGSMSCFRY